MAPLRSPSSKVRARDYVLMRLDTLAEIEKAIVKNFGASGAYVALYNAGREVGASAYKRYVRLEDTEDTSEILARFVKRKDMANWGRFKFTLRNGRPQSVRIFRPFEATVGSGLKMVAGDKCRCPILRGYLEAFLGGLLKKPIELERSSCVIAGTNFVNSK